MIDRTEFSKADVNDLLNKLDDSWEMAELTPWDLELIYVSLNYYRDKYIG